VLNKVKAVEPNSGAAKAGLQPGDLIKKVEFEDKLIGTREIELGEERNWMQVFERMQSILPDTEVKLIYERDGKEKTSVLQPEDSDEWFVPARGFRLFGLTKIHTAKSVGEACALGYRNTVESLLHVVKFLQKLCTGKVSPKNLGGPAMIAVVAGSEAKVGMARLLLFLTLLSANLAIINFLPIPVLDGGHMLFLLYEGIMRKPVNEVWAMRLTVAGLVFILGLMAFVISLDVYRIAQWLGA
jgi:regulator of sigma E protease